MAAESSAESAAQSSAQSSAQSLAQLSSAAMISSGNVGVVIDLLDVVEILERIDHLQQLLGPLGIELDLGRGIDS